MSSEHFNTTYDRWIRQEGPPIVTGYGVTDIRALELGPWPRVGGRGAYIQLEGMEGFTGLYVGQIPPGGALAPEKHMYEELQYVLSGWGMTQIWTDGSDKPAGSPSFFEWQPGSLFTPPLNTWHQLHNASSSEPVLFLGATNAPLVMDLYHSLEFVFGCDHHFRDRYAGQKDYFKKAGEHRPRSDGAGMILESNLISDARGTELDECERKGAGVSRTAYELGGNVLICHVAEWPVGRYQKAHYHGGGAVLLIVRSHGYTLMWPQEVGIRPFESGRGDSVVKVDWQEGSVFSPPTGWFHQHFNTGQVPGRQLGLRYGSDIYGMRFYDIHAREGVYVSVRQGGSLIEYEDEDPEIRRLFSSECAKNGVEVQMPR